MGSWQLARASLKIGVTGFGGPMPMLALVHTEVVQKRGLVDQVTFDEAVMVGQILPGPFVVDVATYIGYRLNGRRADRGTDPASRPAASRHAQPAARCGQHPLRHGGGEVVMVHVLASVVAALLLAATLWGSAPSAASETSHISFADAALQSELESYLAALDGTYGIAVRNLEDGRTVLINADRDFPTASMYKLLVMYRVFEEIGRGGLSLDDTLIITEDDLSEVGPDDSDLGPGDALTVEEALEAMITVSSNAAAFALARTVGGWGEVEAAADELGIELAFDDGAYQSSPADLLRFFELLADRSLVHAEASEQMIALLLRQQVNDRIPALLPPGTYVAHKTGEYEDVRNDGGIVFGPRSRYILVMMSMGDAPAQAVAAESVVSRTVYDRYGS